MSRTGNGFKDLLYNAFFSSHSFYLTWGMFVSLGGGDMLICRSTVVILWTSIPPNRDIGNANLNKQIKNNCGKSFLIVEILWHKKQGSYRYLKEIWKSKPLTLTSFQRSRYISSFGFQSGSWSLTSDFSKALTVDQHKCPDK